MQPPCADRHAQADLARPLRDRDQQDVHNADAANQQRDRRHGGEQKCHDAATALGGFDKLAQIAHREIIELAGFDAMAMDKLIYIGLLEQLIAKDIAATRREMAVWREANALFSRLRIWAAGRGD